VGHLDPSIYTPRPVCHSDGHKYSDRTEMVWIRLGLLDRTLIPDVGPPRQA